jgi:hypothetical protein
MSNQLPETQQGTQIPVDDNLFNEYARLTALDMILAARKAQYDIHEIEYFPTKTRGTYRWVVLVTVGRPSIDYKDDYAAVRKLIDCVFQGTRDAVIQHLRNPEVDTYRVTWFTYAPKR